MKEISYIIERNLYFLVNCICNLIVWLFKFLYSLSLSPTSGVVDADLFTTTGVDFEVLSTTSVYLYITKQLLPRYKLILEWRREIIFHHVNILWLPLFVINSKIFLSLNIVALLRCSYSQRSLNLKENIIFLDLYITFKKMSSRACTTRS